MVKDRIAESLVGVFADVNGISGVYMVPSGDVIEVFTVIDEDEEETYEAICEAVSRVLCKQFRIGAVFLKCFFPCCRRRSGWWKSGNPALGFPLFHRPHFSILCLLALRSETTNTRRSCENVGISPVLGEISKGLVERGGSLPLAFHAFHSPAISTALFLLCFRFGRRPPSHSPSGRLSAS